MVRRPWWPPRMADVAERSGVSLATASRALARQGDGEAPLPHATAQILEVATQLGYRRTAPDVARLHVLVSDIGRTGYWATLSGVLSAALDLGVETSLHVLAGSPARRRETLQCALDTRVDGVVVLEFDSPSVAVLPELPVDLPVAIAGGRPEDGPGQVLGVDPWRRAWTDDRAGAVTATEYLADLGHRRIAYVGVPAAGHPDPRREGWRQVLEARGMTMLDPLATGWSVETGMRAARAVRAARATAVLCGNDDLAIGLIAGLDRLGLRVPEDVSVVGMDDHPHAAATRPALTTVRLDFAAVGEAAARLALGGDAANGVLGGDAANGVLGGDAANGVLGGDAAGRVPREGDVADECGAAGIVEIPTSLVIRGSAAAPIC